VALRTWQSYVHTMQPDELPSQLIYHALLRICSIPPYSAQTMELTSPAHPIDANATYRLPDGSLTYTIEASGFFTKKTQIWKLSGNIRAVIGQLTCPGDTSKSPDEVIVNGIRIMLEKSSDE